MKLPTRVRRNGSLMCAAQGETSRGRSGSEMMYVQIE